MSDNIDSLVDLADENEQRIWLEQLRDTVSTRWEDLRFPASGVNIDSAATRYAFDTTNMGILFDNNSRYTNEQVNMIGQMPHSWLAGTAIRPHMHWIQDSATVPNWLLGYRVISNGTAPGAFTLVTLSSHAFTYVSGDLAQISIFPEIAMADETISCILEFKLWNDTANTSTEFADAVASAALLKEFDIHYEQDSWGSREEYKK